MHAHSDARLQDSVSGSHNATARIDNSAVQRVGHRADHGGGGSARELRVRVEGDDVVNARECVEIAGFYREGIEIAAQILVEVEKLATLSLPSHPDTLPRVENAMAMEQQEGAMSGRSGVAEVKVVGEAYSEIDEGIGVVFAGATDGVGQIGEQCKVQIGILICQKSDFKVGDKLANLVFVH